MKIAFFVGSFPLLSETFIVNQITGLIDRGHEVDIYAETIATQSIHHAEVVDYGLLGKTQHYDGRGDLRAIGRGKRAMAALSGFVPAFSSTPRPVLRACNVFEFGREASSLGLLFKTYHFLKNRKQYDIILCHFGQRGSLAVQLKKIGVLEGRIVTVFHGADISKYMKIKGKNVYSKLFECGDLFLPISDAWKRELAGLGCPVERTMVHRMGIDTQKFNPRPNRQYTSPRILSVGRLVEKKGIRFALQAFSRVLEKHPQATYRIVGDGPDRVKLETLARDLNLGDRVEFLGWKTQDDVLGLMKESDLFLLPSVTAENGDMEGIPVVLMEAMAIGLPVVSTWHSGIPELVQNGVTGTLVPEREVDALARALKELLGSPKRRRAMGSGGRTYVQEHYDINRLNNRLVSIFTDLLEHPRLQAER